MRNAPVRKLFVGVPSRSYVSRHATEQAAIDGAQRLLNERGSYETEVLIYKLCKVVSIEKAPVKVETISS